MNKRIVFAAVAAAFVAFDVMAEEAVTRDCAAPKGKSDATALVTEYEALLKLFVEQGRIPASVSKEELVHFRSLSPENQMKEFREVQARIDAEKTVEEIKKAAASAPNPREAEYVAWMKKSVELGVCPAERAKMEFEKELERFRGQSPEKQEKELVFVRESMTLRMVERTTVK